jgi:hypothetical protein
MKNPVVWLLLLSVCIFVLTGVAYRSSVSNVDIVVTDKDTKISGSGEGMTQKYLIFTEGETFEITDTVLFFRFDSSDTYGQLKRGSSYHVKVAGWRIPFLSCYRNILEVGQR